MSGLCWTGTYSDHQKEAAKLAAKHFLPLSEDEILIVGATQQPISLSPDHPAAYSKAADNWKKEHAMLIEQLAEHLISECKKVRTYWADLLES